MRLFVGYGYNERDAWIEKQVYPVLRAAGYAVVDGKDMVGDQLSDTVKSRINQSDVAVGFLTAREGQAEAEFSSHLWVYAEMLYASETRRIPVLQVREKGVKVPDTLFGDVAYIELDQHDRLACVALLVAQLARQHLQRIRLDLHSDGLRPKLMAWRKQPAFRVAYRTRDELGLESDTLEGRLETVNQEFFLNVRGLPPGAQIEVDGMLNGSVCFTSGWVSNSGAVTVKVYESGS